MIHRLPEFVSPISPDAADVVLVVGASRGIGYAMVEALLSKPEVLLGSPNHKPLIVLAACRHPQRAEALQALQRQHPQQLALLTLDMANAEAFATLTQQLKSLTPTLRAVVNTAGLLHEPATDSQPALRPEKALSQIRVDAVMRSFSVNAWAPILLAQAVLPLISRQHAFCFASLSARVGSIGDNQLGGWYSYRAAKAAQNQFLKTWSIELARTHPLATVLVLHPGTTDTDLSKPFSAHVVPEKLFTKERVAQDLLAVLRARGPESSGGFFDWANESVPW